MGTAAPKKRAMRSVKSGVKTFKRDYSRLHPRGI